MMRNLVLISAVAVAVACATTGTGTSSSGARRNPNVISEQEIASSNAANAFEAVTILRPAFLRTRGQTSVNLQANNGASVYVNSQQYGEISSLRGISIDQIREIRYYSPSEAVQKFGSQLGTGVIQVITK